MDDRRNKQIVQAVFESSLAGIQDDPWMAQRVLHLAHAAPTKKGESQAIVILSHCNSNLVAIQTRFQSLFSHGPCTFLGRFAVVMCLICIMFCSILLLPQGWIITRQAEDEGQYIMQGIETPAGFGSVADAGPALDRIGTYNTSSWPEVVRLMGGKPHVPQWMPSDWTILTYNVGLTSTSSSLTIIYLNESTSRTLIYQTTTYFELSSLHRYVEQNDEGHNIELANGTQVYITDNIDNISAAWYAGSSDYVLSGSISENELIRVIESID